MKPRLVRAASGVRRNVSVSPATLLTDDFWWECFFGVAADQCLRGKRGDLLRVCGGGIDGADFTQAGFGGDAEALAER